MIKTRSDLRIKGNAHIPCRKDIGFPAIGHHHSRLQALRVHLGIQFLYELTWVFPHERRIPLQKITIFFFRDTRIIFLAQPPLLYLLFQNDKRKIIIVFLFIQMVCITILLKVIVLHIFVIVTMYQEA